MQRPAPPEEVREYDPREGEDWFMRLPPQVRARVTAAWEKERIAFGDGPRQRRQRQRRCARESALLLPALGLLTNLFLIGSFTHFVALIALGALLGAAVGVALATLRGGRFIAVLVGLSGFVTLHLVVTGFRAEMLNLICLFFGGWMSAIVFAIYGVRLESRAVAHSGEV